MGYLDFINKRILNESTISSKIDEYEKPVKKAHDIVSKYGNLVKDLSDIKHNDDYNNHFIFKVRNKKFQIWFDKDSNELMLSNIDKYGIDSSEPISLSEIKKRMNIEQEKTK
jgi:hypothetical protein